MIPQTSTKRKAHDDSNPLLNPVKKARKDQPKSGASTKRKHPNGEQQVGGLIIVRTSSAQPAPAASAPKSQDEPSSSNPQPPPMKKFRADSQPPQSSGNAPSRNPLPRSTSKSQTASFLQDDPSIEEDVRAMEDESDYLRRKARQAVLDPSLLTRTVEFPPASDYASPVRRPKGSTTGQQSQPRPNSKREDPKSSQSSTRGSSREPEGSERRGRSEVAGSSRVHHRKSSIGGRGKRISDVFESSGVIVQPHRQVIHQSFYKHIDVNRPDTERLRQLLIWCTARSFSDDIPDSLSEKSVQILKGVQEDMTKMLAEDRINLAPSFNTPSEKLKENPQNVSNRRWEGVYSDQIQKAQEEDEAWKKVSYFYEAFLKKEQAQIAKRKAQLSELSEEPVTPSSKALGKRKATESEPDFDQDQLPRMHELSDQSRAGMELVQSVLGLSDRARSAKVQREAKTKERLKDLEFNLDRLHAFANTAKSTTLIAERALDQRFALLSATLTARSNPFPTTVIDPDVGSGAQLLSTYVPRPGLGQPDPLELMRALSRIDLDRPPAQVGDAARRARREVQRVEESGLGAIGERRLTSLPSSQTPRKTPGTPRRGGTPAQDKGPQWD